MFQVDTKFTNANISRTVRFPNKLFQKLTAVAMQYEISFNTLILQCCQYALDNQKQEEK